MTSSSASEIFICRTPLWTTGVVVRDDYIRGQQVFDDTFVRCRSSQESALVWLLFGVAVEYGPLNKVEEKAMKRVMIAAIAVATLPAGCATKGSSGDFGRVLGEVLSQQTGDSSLTQAEIDAGLREALTVGTNLVAAQLGQTNGYFGDPEIRIPLPKTYRDIQSGLSRVGASGPLDDLELRMNRAAEDSVPEAKTLVLGAIRQITIEDAVRILNGGDTAATDFLRAKTESQLRASFTPYVRSSLAEAGAFTSLEQVANSYGVGGVTTTLQNDLTDHAVSLGLDGLFHYVALEEKKIRENPVARTTELLRRVFGSRG
ncbi:MAG TPA: DUF4197 domain-containing protein [Hyphomonas atlantica]|nr:DUF4197 domain-containing protein [Hyphomonas atlantica]